MKKEFKYRSNSELLQFVGQTVQWLDANDNVKSATLELFKSRTVLPESGGVYADTVKTKIN